MLYSTTADAPQAPGLAPLRGDTVSHATGASATSAWGSQNCISMARYKAMGASAASVTPSGRWRLLAGGGVAREVPHASQNFALGRFSAPQALQCTGSGAAHSVYSLVLLVRQRPLRRQLWHEEIEVVEL